MFTSKGIIHDGKFYSLLDIKKEVYSKLIKEKELQLLTIEWKSSRGFNGAKEQIVLSKTEAEFLVERIKGLYIHFGEIAGKHSCIEGTIDEEDISVIDDEKVVLEFLLNFPNGHEYNHSFLFTFMWNYDDERDNKHYELYNLIDDIHSKDLLDRY